jgi:zinc protease
MILDRTIPPPIQPIQDFTLIKPKNVYLENGMPAHFVSAGVQPIVSVQVIFEAGNWSVPSADINHFTAKMLLEGTEKHTGSELSEKIDGYGAFLDVGTAMDYASIDFQCLKKYLPQMLEIVQELLTKATFPAQELEKLKTIAIQNIKINSQKTSVVASHEFRARLFGANHPYGYSMSEQSVENVSIEQIKEHYAYSFFQQPFRVIVAGEISDAEIQSIAQTLGNLLINKNIPSNSILRIAQTQTSKTYIEKENAVQSSIRIGKNVLHRQDPDFVPFNVLNTILGGFFGSRLMKNIREEKGLSYGIGSSLGMLKNAGYLMIGTDVKKELRQQAIDEIYKEIQQLTQKPISNDELDLVKNYLKGSFVGSLNTPFALAERYRNVYSFDLEEDYYDHQIRRIDQVSSEKLMELAQKYYQNDFVEVSVG